MMCTSKLKCTEWTFSSCVRIKTMPKASEKSLPQITRYHVLFWYKKMLYAWVSLTLPHFLQLSGSFCCGACDPRLSEMPWLRCCGSALHLKCVCLAGLTPESISVEVQFAWGWFSFWKTCDWYDAFRLGFYLMQIMTSVLGNIPNFLRIFSIFRSWKLFIRTFREDGHSWT